MRPVLPAVRPFRAGALCLILSALLLFGAGGEPVRDNGGVAGQALHDAAAKGFSDVGASIIAIFLAIAGVLLLTGASVAGVLRATHSHVTETTRGLRDRRRPAGDDDWDEPPAESPFFGPPEPDGEEPVVRPRTTGGSLDGAMRSPALFGSPAEMAVTAPPKPEAEEPEAAPESEPEPIEPAPAPIATKEPAKDSRTGLDLELGGRGGVDHDFALPDPRLLKRSTPEQARPDTAGQEQTAARLVEALGHLGVQAQVIGAVAGPHITRYELQLAPGVKMAKVANLKNDLAYALAATEIRILAPIPGKRAVGVEVPNRHRRIVTLGDVLGDPPPGSSPLTVWLGKDVSGKAISADLAKMPHLLVAGTTGAGKSGAVNAML